MGDLNTPPDPEEEVYRTLNATFRDAWSEAGGTPLEGKTWPTDHALYRIDYIWLKGRFVATAGSTKLLGNPKASDHLALACTIQF